MGPLNGTKTASEDLPAENQPAQKRRGLSLSMDLADCGGNLGEEFDKKVEELKGTCSDAMITQITLTNVSDSINFLRESKSFAAVAPHIVVFSVKGIPADQRPDGYTGLKHLPKPIMRDLTSLKALFCMDVNLVHVNNIEFAGDGKIETLILSRNKLAEIPSSILRRFGPSLSKLNLSDNALTSCPDLALCPKLRELRMVHNTGITQLTGIGSLQELRVLALNGTGIPDIASLGEISRCRLLVNLSLSGTPLSQSSNYKETITVLLPRLQILDGGQLRSSSPTKQGKRNRKYTSKDIDTRVEEYSTRLRTAEARRAAAAQEEQDMGGKGGRRRKALDISKAIESKTLRLRRDTAVRLRQEEKKEAMAEFTHHRCAGSARPPPETEGTGSAFDAQSRLSLQREQEVREQQKEEAKQEAKKEVSRYEGRYSITTEKPRHSVSHEAVDDLLGGNNDDVLW